MGQIALQLVAVIEDEPEESHDSGRGDYRRSLLQRLILWVTPERCDKPFLDVSMNTEVIVETAHSTLAETISYPEVVQLLDAGVEYYQVDNVRLQKTFYTAGGDTLVTPIAYKGLPPVAADFDEAGLRAAILASQRAGQKYRDFTCRAMAAAADTA